MAAGDLGRKSLLLLGSTWGHGAVGFVVSLLVARALGAEALGAIALNLGLASLVMAVLLPGFLQAHFKRLAEGQDAGRCLGTMLAVQALLTAVLAAVLLALARWRGTDALAAQPAVLAFMLAAQATSRFGEAFLRVFLAREWVVPHAAVLVGARLARLAAVGAVLAWAPSVAAVAATYWLETLLSASAAAALLAARYGVRPRRPTRDSVRGYWIYARPFLVTAPIALVQDSIDRYLVGRWAGLTAAGHYHVARSLWEVMASVIAPPGQLLFARLSSLYAQRSAERDRQARELFFRAVDKLLLVTAALGVAFWLLAEPLLALLYGASFTPAAAALRIFVLAALAANAVNPYTFVLQAQDEVARFVPLNLARLALYLVWLAVLVPEPSPLGLAWLPAGDAGAAAARLLLIVVLSWVYVGWTRELAGIAFYRPALLYVAALAAGVGAGRLAEALAARAGLSAPAALLVAAGVGLAGYLGLLLAVHPRTRQNLRDARALLSVREFTALVRGGFRPG